MEIEIRVGYHETDRMGIVHHSHYFPWFEKGRIELIRQRGFSYAGWEKSGFYLPVIETHCRFLAPVYFDDLLTLEIEGPVQDRLRLNFSYTLTRRADKKVAARAGTTHVIVNHDGKPIKWPKIIKTFLEANK